MSERHPTPNETPPIDPPGREAPVRGPSGGEAPPPENGSGKPGPHERVQKLRLGVRVVWWSAVALTVGFGAVALWMGVGQRDPFFALFYLVLAVCCALAGYGTLLAFRRSSAS